MKIVSMKHTMSPSLKNSCPLKIQCCAIYRLCLKQYLIKYVCNIQTVTKVFTSSYTVIADPSFCCARQRMIVGCDGPVTVLHDVPQENIVVSIESSRYSMVGLDVSEDE